MNAAYLLALGISVLFIAGFVLALARFIRQPGRNGLMASRSVSVFALRNPLHVS
jgi:hypothetical protein